LNAPLAGGELLVVEIEFECIHRCSD